MKNLLLLVSLLLATGYCMAQELDYKVKKPETELKESAYPLAGLTDVSHVKTGKPILLSILPKDTFHLLKTPINIGDKFILALKMPTPVISCNISVSDYDKGEVYKASIAGDEGVGVVVSAMLNSIIKSNKVAGMIYNFTYINESGKKVKLDKVLVILP